MILTCMFNLLLVMTKWADSTKLMMLTKFKIMMKQMVHVVQSEQPTNISTDQLINGKTREIASYSGSKFKRNIMTLQIDTNDSDWFIIH